METERSLLSCRDAHHLRQNSSFVKVTHSVFLLLVDLYTVFVFREHKSPKGGTEGALYSCSAPGSHQELQTFCLHFLILSFNE